MDTWRSAYRGIVPDEVLDGLSYEERQARHHQRLSDPEGRTFTLVAEDGSRSVIGFAVGGPERSGDIGYDGELHAIYVHPFHQRKGVGRELVKSVAGRLINGGTQSMIVWVLAANPWRQFYESIGGKVLDLEANFNVAEGVELPEVAYAWEDLGALQSKL